MRALHEFMQSQPENTKYHIKINRFEVNQTMLWITLSVVQPCCNYLHVVTAKCYPLLVFQWILDGSSDNNLRLCLPTTNPSVSLWPSNVNGHTSSSQSFVARPMPISETNPLDDGNTVCHHTRARSINKLEKQQCR